MLQSRGGGINWKIVKTMTWLGVGGKIDPCNSVISSYPVISSYFVKFRETFAENEWIKDYYLLGVWLAPWHQSLRTPIIIINLVKRFDQLYFTLLLSFFTSSWSSSTLSICSSCLSSLASIFRFILLQVQAIPSFCLLPRAFMHSDEIPEAEFKEFKPRFKFKPRLKFFLFHLNLY